MISCDPTSLGIAAKCFQCIDQKTLQAIKTFLLCQYASGITDCNLIPAGATYSFVGGYFLGLTTDAGIIQGQSYLITFGPNEVEVNNGQIGGILTATGILIGNNPGGVFDFPGFVFSLSSANVPVTATVCPV